MARDVFTVVLLEQRWMVRHHGRHSPTLRYPGRSHHRSNRCGPQGRNSQPGWRAGARPGLQQRLPNGVDLRRRSAAATLTTPQTRGRSHHHLAIWLTQYQTAAINKATTTEPPRTTRPRKPQVTGSFRQCEICGLIPRPPCTQCCRELWHVNQDTTCRPALSELGQLTDSVPIGKTINRPRRPVDASTRPSGP